MPPVVSILLALDRDSILRIVVRAQRSAWSGLVAACRRSITSDCDNMIDMPLFGNDVMLHNGEPDVPILLRVDTRRYTTVSSCAACADPSSRRLVWFSTGHLRLLLGTPFTTGQSGL